MFTCGVVIIGLSLKKHRALVMGITFSGIGLGNFAYPFLATYLMNTYGWRGALLITSSLTLNVCVCGMFMVGGKVPDGPDAPNCSAHSHNDETICEANNALKPPLMIKHAPSVDRVLMTHSVQSLHSIIAKRIGEERQLEKASSIEGIACRRFLHAQNVTYFSSLQTLNAQGKDRDLTKIENGLCAKISHSRSSMYDSNKNTGSQCQSVDETGHYLPTTNRGKSALLDDATSDDIDHNRTSYFYPFRLYQYWLLQFNTLLFCLSLSVVLTHVFAYSQYQGLKQDKATILIAINGAASAVGRISLGALAQHRKISTILLFIVCYAAAGVACLLMTVWTSFAGLSICVVCFGFFTSAFGPVLSEVTVEILGLQHFNFGYGYLMIAMAIGITVGAPTAGAWFT